MIAAPFYIYDLEPHEDFEFVRTREFEKLSNGAFVTPICFECRSYTHNMLAWCPESAEERELAQEPAGRMRLIFFPICDGCLQRHGENVMKHLSWNVTRYLRVNTPTESVGFKYKH